MIGNLTDKSKRIRKLILKHPEMTDEQVSRKIGMPDSYGEWRVERERYLMSKQQTGNLHRNPHPHRGGEDQTHETCVPMVPPTFSPETDRKS